LVKEEKRIRKEVAFLKKSSAKNFLRLRELAAAAAVEEGRRGLLI
jgi:hypothetical protein